MTKTPKWGSNEVTEAMFSGIHWYKQLSQPTGKSAQLNADANVQESDRTSSFPEWEVKVSVQQVIEDAWGDVTS